jgi:DNA-binding IclR family transcriptional regulator
MKKTIYSAPSVKKAIKILQTIADSSGGLGVSELAKRLGMGKSTVHGITSGLEELGVLVRDPIHKKFDLGYTLLELSRKAYTRIQLRDAARIPMGRLLEKVGETVFLGIMNGDHVTILDVAESHHEMKLTSPPGARLPLLVAATGKVFLAGLDEERAKEIVHRMGLVKYTAKSVVDPKKFLKGVEEAKKKGYAIDDEEYILGVRAIAATIQTYSFPPAAIWLAGFASALSDEKMEKMISEIRKTAQEISQWMKEHVR